MAACTKVRDESGRAPSSPVTETLSAVREGEVTKISMNSRREFGWSPSDDIAVSVIQDETWTMVKSEPCSEGLFTLTYEGERRGVAVLPSLFAKKYDGSNLTVSYPSSYSIADEVDAGTYDNADGASHIWFPMVAESTPESRELVFRSIGALVKVVVREVPKGTRKLYIGFNRRVTGDFPVQDLGTGAPPYVEAEEGASQIEYTISSTGLGKATDITLYIPVPTCFGLSISSTTETKEHVDRNAGYEFNVRAISRVSSETDFSLAGVNHILAPGNLYAYNNSGTIEYHNRTATEQTITTLGTLHNDPHKDKAKLLDINEPGNYRDMFTWDQLYGIFNYGGYNYDGLNEEAPPSDAGAVIDGTLDIDGVGWKVPSLELMRAIFNGEKSRDRRATIEVGGLSGMVCAAAEIDLLNSDLFYYYQVISSLSGNLSVYGRFLFPDGYVDMTDLLRETATGNVQKGDGSNRLVSIDSAAYEQMVKAGAIFLVNGGMADDGAVLSSCGRNHLAYVFGTTRVAGKCDGMAATAYKVGSFQTTVSRNYYRSVRLYREEDPSAGDSGSTPALPGYDNKPETEW